MKINPKIHIGTSGWVSKAWHNNFYPPQEKNYLQYYSKHFNSVEVNSSFYHLPKADTFSKWRTEVGKEFIFSVKLSRAITHLKRFKGVDFYLENFLFNYSGLKSKRGPILVQLPPTFRFDLRILERFFKLANKYAKKLKLAKMRWAFEPRHPSWFDGSSIQSTLFILNKNNAVPVFAHSEKFPGYDPDSGAKLKFIYVRLHGPEDFAASQYAVKLLKPWSRRIKKWNKEGLDVFLYFNNDVHGYAIKDAQILLRLLE